MRVLDRSTQPVGAGLTLPTPAARGLRINRRPAQAGLNGRGHSSLVAVLGFHLDQADSRRVAARKRTLRRSKALRSVECGAVHARSAGSGCGARPLVAAARRRRGQGSRIVRSHPHGREAGRRLRLTARRGGRSGQRAVKRAAHARRGIRHAGVAVRSGCSLTIWVCTSSLDAPRAGTLRQEALLDAPLATAAQGRMPCAVRSWERGAQRHPRASIRLGGGAAVGNHRNGPKDETLVDASLPHR